MTQFAHGSQAGVLLADRDLTRFTSDFNYATDVAQEESTCLQAPGGAKEFLTGNNGATASINGRLSRSFSLVQRDLAAMMGQENDPNVLTLAPFSFEVGRRVLMYKTRSQSFRVTGGTTALVNTSASFQADGQTRAGTMLLSPRGTATLSLNQKYNLSAAGALVAGVYTVRDALNNTLGTVTLNLGDTAAQVATKIAALSYNGSALAATVNGSVANGYVVANAPDTSYNGTYVANGSSQNGAPIYQKDSSHFLYFAVKWKLGGDPAGIATYTSNGANTADPTASWTTITVAQGGANGTFAVEITTPAATPLVFSTATTGWAAQEVQHGGVTNGLNVISVATTGTAVKTASAATVTTENRSAAHLHATFVSTGTVSIPAIIEHAPDVSGSPGTWAQLLAFTTITDGTNRAQTAQQVILPAGTTIQPWLRVRVPSITGSAAIGVAFAR